MTHMALYSAAGGHHHQGTHGGFVPIMNGDNPFADLGSVEKTAVKLRVLPPNASSRPSSTSSSTLNEMRQEKEKARGTSPHAGTMESPFAESPAPAAPTPLENGNETTPTSGNGYKATPPLDSGMLASGKPPLGNGNMATLRLLWQPFPPRIRRMTVRRRRPDDGSRARDTRQGKARQRNRLNHGTIGFQCRFDCYADI